MNITDNKGAWQRRLAGGSATRAMSDEGDGGEDGHNYGEPDGKQTIKVIIVCVIIVICVCVALLLLVSSIFRFIIIISIDDHDHHDLH